MPVGPSYRDRCSRSRSTRAWSAAVPVTCTGRVWATSASRAPRVMTISTPRSRATEMTCSPNVRHRSWGSIPTSTTTSWRSPGSDAAENSFDGHTISRVRPSTNRTWGRVDEKS